MFKKPQKPTKTLEPKAQVKETPSKAKPQKSLSKPQNPKQNSFTGIHTVTIGIFGSPDWKNTNRVTDAFAGLEASNSTLTFLDTKSSLSKIGNEIAKRKGILCFTIPLEDIDTKNQKVFEESIESYFVFEYCLFFQKTPSTFLTTLIGLAKQKNIPFSIISE